MIAALTIFVAAIVAGSLQPIGNVLLAAISTALITAGANVINDYFDIDIDKINKPKRPLVSENLKPGEAFNFFVILYLAGWICAVYIHWAMFIIALVIGILMFLYSYKLKRTILWGNLIVSFATATAFIYGGLAVNRIEATLFPACFAFLYHFGREILKDIQDIDGDKREGLLTFPIKYGIKSSINLILFIYILLIVSTIIPYILQVYSIKYLLIILLGVYPIIILVLYKIIKMPEPKNLGNMSNLLKSGMFVGLFAIYLG